MRLQPYRDRDIPALVSLVNERDILCYEFIPYSEEKLRVELKEASYALLAVDEQDRVHGLAYLWPEWWGEIVILYAPAGPGQSDAGKQLLSAVEQQSRTGGLIALIDPADQERLAAFSAIGYRSETTSYQMVTQLGQMRPLPQVPEGYIIRSLRSDEEQALIRLAEAAYGMQRLEPGILGKWKTEDPAFSLDCIKVAQYGEQLVALVVARSDREYNRHYHTKRGYLGPAGTLPLHRGKGLTKALTAEAMNSLRERGMDTVCLHTLQTNQPALTVARDLGFCPVHEWIIMRKALH